MFNSVMSPVEVRENYQLEYDIENLNQRRPSLLSHDILAEGEESLYESRPLLWPLLARPILFSIVGLLILVFAGRLPLDSISAFFGQFLSSMMLQTILKWAGVAILTVGVLGVIVRWLRWRSTIYSATNQRILLQTGILTKCYIDCSISKIQTLHLQIPLLGMIFGFGTIRIATASAASTEIKWEGIHKPKYAHRRLNEIIEHHQYKSRAEE